MSDCVDECCVWQVVTVSSGRVWDNVWRCVSGCVREGGQWGGVCGERGQKCVGVCGKTSNFQTEFLKMIVFYAGLSTITARAFQ